MLDSSQENRVALFKYWRLFELELVSIYVFAIGSAVAIVHNSEWHEHLLRLLGRAWSAFVAQDVGSQSHFQTHWKRTSERTALDFTKNH